MPVTAAVAGILDTDAVILLDALGPQHLPAEPLITAITLAELSVGPLVPDDPGERAARQVRLQGAEAFSTHFRSTRSPHAPTAGSRPTFDDQGGEPAPEPSTP